MKIPEKGMTKEAILAALDAYKADDLPWETGRIMGFVYDPGEAAKEVAKEAYMKYLGENALDPTTYPSVMRLEREVVRMIINLLRGDDAVVGNMTSGGTESILAAMKAARDWARATRPEVKAPEMLMAGTAHPAFHKACAYFDITPVVTPFDRETFRADVDAMRNAITGNTIIIVGSAPGYAQGVVDPIEEIGALAQEHGLWFHVDGCVGGIHLSFMRKLGYDVPAFDFTVPGVTSISADMHKYGYAPKNASVLMYRNKAYRKHQIFACTHTTTYVVVNPTVMSTKTGGPMAGSWAMLHFLGEEGYMKIVQELQEATRRLVDGVNAIDGMRVLGKPDMCMFSFTSDTVNVFEVADEMNRRGWYVQPQLSTPYSPPNLHVTVNPSSVPHVDALLAELRDAVEAVRSNENAIDIETVRGVVKQLLESAEGDPAEQIMALGGVTSGELPGGLALINTVMDCLPDSVTEEMLIGYFNDLFA